MKAKSMFPWSPVPSAGVALLLLASGPSRAHAAFVFTVAEIGGSVVVRGSGSINTTELSPMHFVQTFASPFDKPPAFGDPVFVSFDSFARDHPHSIPCPLLAKDSKAAKELPSVHPPFTATIGRRSPAMGLRWCGLSGLPRMASSPTAPHLSRLCKKPLGSCAEFILSAKR